MPHSHHILNAHSMLSHFLLQILIVNIAVDTLSITNQHFFFFVRVMVAYHTGTSDHHIKVIHSSLTTVSDIFSHIVSITTITINNIVALVGQHINTIPFFFMFFTYCNNYPYMFYFNLIYKISPFYQSLTSSRHLQDKFDPNLNKVNYNSKSTRATRKETTTIIEWGNYKNSTRVQYNKE